MKCYLGDWTLATARYLGDWSPAVERGLPALGLEEGLT